MRLAPQIAVALTLLLACQSTEDASHTPSPTMTFAASATPSPSLTPTPECDEKCQMLRTFTPVPTTTVSPPPITYPAQTRTGVGEVDAIISSVEARDAADLAKLIFLTRLPCRAQGNMQPEPLLCREGVAPGTPKTGIWITHVEGGLREMTESEVASLILGIAADRDWKLHSVYSYEKAGTRPDWIPETDYFITFASWHPQGGPQYDNLRIVDGGITGVHYAFGEPYPQFDDPADPGWLIPRAR
jgi:hypothetical protein